MAHDQTRSQGASNGPAHYGGYGLSGSGTAQSAPPYSRDRQGNPHNDTHYTEAVRRPPDNHDRLRSVTNNPALRLKSNSLYGVPHASPHGEARGYSLGNGLSAPHTGQTQPGEANTIELAGYSSYVRQILHQAPEYNYDEPYNAIGYIRRDGRVYDNDELYEEYRQYEQVGRLEENRSDAWTNVQTGTRR